MPNVEIQVTWHGPYGGREITLVQGGTYNGLVCKVILRILYIIIIYQRARDQV